MTTKIGRMAVAGATVLLLLPAGSFADDVPGSVQNPLSPEQAIARQGQSVTVEGRANVTEADGMPGVFVRLSNPDSHVPFVGYVETNNEGKFPDLRALQGRVVDITGIVETRSTPPMIKLTSADQIKIVR